MTRDVLLAILRGSNSFSEKAGVFKTAPDHRVTFYLGSDQRGMVVQEISSVAVKDEYLELSAETTGNVYTSLEHLHAVAVKPPKEAAPKKAGFA